MTFRAIDPASAKIYYAKEADRPITTLNIPDGSLVIFTDSGLEDSFDSVADAWFNREQITQDNSGKTAGLMVIGGPASEMVASRRLALPTVTTKQSIQLWNPAASGVNLAITYAAFGGDALNMSLDMYLTTLADTTEDTRKSNKDMAGAAPSAELYIGEDETGGTLFSTIVAQSNLATDPRWELSGIIIPPGNGIRWKEGTADKRIIYALNWTETAV